jgi:hypothetical protein
VAIVVWVVAGAELVHSLSGNAVLFRWLFVVVNTGEQP